jgi:hypothetical protein
MVTPPSASFFSPGAGPQAQEFLEMVGLVLIGLTLREKIEVLLDETLAASQEKGNLSYLHLLLGQLGAADEGGQIVADRLGTMVHELADLGHGLAFQG